jgi:Leu/Phe-tRNA-protein transferase
MFKQIVATLSKMSKQVYFTIASEPSPIAWSRRSNRAVLRARKQQFSRTLRDSPHDQVEFPLPKEKFS